MGFSGKAHQINGGLRESDGKKWVLAGIQLRGPLKPIHTNPADNETDDDGLPTTPTAAKARIPTVLPCPPAPKKRRQSLKCNCAGARDFFSPPDLDTVFIQKAS